MAEPRSGPKRGPRIKGGQVRGCEWGDMRGGELCGAAVKGRQVANMRG